MYCGALFKYELFRLQLGRITTAHSSKGLEYDAVYLMDVYDGQFPGTSLYETDGRKSDMDVLQEERRLFYVAMTRAKNHLYVFKIKGKKTSFVDEILPSSDPGKPNSIENAYYRIEQYRKEFEQRLRDQEAAKRKAVETVQAKRAKEAAERYIRGFEQVKEKSFQTEEIIEDSFGIRWLQCEQCAEIKTKDDFALVGRRNRPGIGICTACARKIHR